MSQGISEKALISPLKTQDQQQCAQSANKNNWTDAKWQLEQIRGGQMLLQMFRWRQGRVKEETYKQHPSGAS